MINRPKIIDRKPFAPRHRGDFHLLPGVTGAVRALHRRGFPVVVVTNQPDIGNALAGADEVAAMHKALARRLPVARIECCPHAQTDGCGCRKPKPGMLIQAARALGIDLARSVMVGDRLSDIQAGRAAGCATVFVARGYREGFCPIATARATSLPDALPKILALLSRPG